MKYHDIGLSLCFDCKSCGHFLKFQHFHNESGEYSYARWTLQRLERILDGEYNKLIFPLTFSGRDYELPLEEIVGHLRNLMDVAFKSVMNIEEYDDDDAVYAEAKSLFINEDGLPYGAVMYGLFLNLWYSNVFRIHPSLKHAVGATVENVHIHDLHHKTMEYVRMDDGTRCVFTVFATLK